MRCETDAAFAASVFLDYEREPGMNQTQTGLFRRLWELFFSFFKIGLFTFGGGYAMLSIIENEFVEKKGWMSEQEMMDMIAIAESTPGPVAINSATYVGYRNGGFWGAFCATLGCVLPSFTIIFLISLFLEPFMKITLVAKAFHGIRAAVAVLIINAARKLRKSVKLDVAAWLLILAVVAAELAGVFLGFELSSIVMILVGAVVGLVLYGLGAKGKEEKK